MTRPEQSKPALGDAPPHWYGMPRYWSAIDAASGWPPGTAAWAVVVGVSRCGCCRRGRVSRRRSVGRSCRGARCRAVVVCWERVFASAAAFARSAACCRARAACRARRARAAAAARACWAASRAWIWTICVLIEASSVRRFASIAPMTARSPFSCVSVARRLCSTFWSRPVAAIRLFLAWIASVATRCAEEATALECTAPH